MSQSTYQPKKGEEKYAAVRVTKKNGQPLANPSIELYDPAVLGSVLGLNGFEAEVVYDPRTAAQKGQKVSASAVKYQKELNTDSDYRTRYTELFKQEVPYNITVAEIRRAVDAAEEKLPQILQGAKVVHEPVFLQDTTTTEAVTAEELPSADATPVTDVAPGPKGKK